LRVDCSATSEFALGYSSKADVVRLIQVLRDIEPASAA
jgi:hypothetical protein